jgi:hypothetical protein
MKKPAVAAFFISAIGGRPIAPVANAKVLIALASDVRFPEESGLGGENCVV